MKRLPGYLPIIILFTVICVVFMAGEDRCFAREFAREKAQETSKIKKDIEKIKEQLSELTGGIQFSGFFDVNASGFKDNPNVFALGDFELDIEKSVGDNFQVAAALVFNDDGAELAVGFIDFHLFGGPVSARGRLFTEKGLHLQVGRFDVPFGNDWQYYASADRTSISAPLTTEVIMGGGYNDVGLRILRANVSYHFTLFMLRGIEEGISLGGRFALTPFNNPFTFKRKQIQKLELGVSYIMDMDRGGCKEEKILALDMESQLGPVHLQGEFLRKDYHLEETRMEGFHVSAFLDTGFPKVLPLTVYGRYDFTRCKSLDSVAASGGAAVVDELSRLTAGVNVNLFDVSMLKIEYMHYLEENEEFRGASFFIQLVITF